MGAAPYRLIDTEDTMMDKLSLQSGKASRYINR